MSFSGIRKNYEASAFARTNMVLLWSNLFKSYCGILKYYAIQKSLLPKFVTVLCLYRHTVFVIDQGKYIESQECLFVWCGRGLQMQPAKPFYQWWKKWCLQKIFGLV